MAGWKHNLYIHMPVVVLQQGQRTRRKQAVAAQCSSAARVVAHFGRIFIAPTSSNKHGLNVGALLLRSCMMLFAGQLPVYVCML